MHCPKVLIISDEPETAQVWGYSLIQLDLDVLVIGITEHPLQAFDENPTDLIIIEDFNTENDELELCKQLRKVTLTPILYLTGKTPEAFCLEVYRGGADECIPLPISPRLFQAKVKAWLRRIQTIPATALGEIKACGFRLNPAYKILTLATGKTIRLTGLESRLLLVLMNRPGTTFEKHQLIEQVWGYHGEGDIMLLKNLVYRLRRKIEPDPSRPRYLLRSGNTGYRLQQELEDRT